MSGEALVCCEALVCSGDVDGDVSPAISGVGDDAIVLELRRNEVHLRRNDGSPWTRKPGIVRELVRRELEGADTEEQARVKSYWMRTPITTACVDPGCRAAGRPPLH